MTEIKIRDNNKYWQGYRENGLPIHNLYDNNGMKDEGGHRRIFNDTYLS